VSRVDARYVTPSLRHPQSAIQHHEGFYYLYDVDTTVAACTWVGGHRQLSSCPKILRVTFSTTLLALACKDSMYESAHLGSGGARYSLTWLSMGEVFCVSVNWISWRRHCEKSPRYNGVCHGWDSPTFHNHSTRKNTVVGTMFVSL
jgi:hypothetical protein